MSKDSLFSEPVILKVAGALFAQAPAFAGAVVSLAFVGQLSTRGRIMAVCVGFLTAVYLGPGIIEALNLFWPAMPVKMGQGILFLIALSAMGSLPKLIKWIDTMAGDPLGLLHRLRPPAVTPANDPPANDPEAPAPAKDKGDAA